MNRLQRLIITRSLSDGRDGFRKGVKSFKEKKLNRILGFKAEAKRTTGINSLTNAPSVAEAYTAIQEEYMDLVEFMRLKVLFPKEVSKVSKY